MGLFDKNNTNVHHNVTSPAHTQLAQSISAAATVLLQNHGGLLPIAKAAKSLCKLQGEWVDFKGGCYSKNGASLKSKSFKVRFFEGCMKLVTRNHDVML